MSWAKLASNSRSSTLLDKDTLESLLSTASRRGSSASSTGSTSSMKGLFKRLSAGKPGTSESSEKAPHGSWRSIKRMTVSTDSRNSDRNSPLRSSDGSVGPPEVARNALQQAQEGSSETGQHKLSMAFRKIGKAHLGFASLLS